MALDLRSPTIVKLLKYSSASFAGLVVGPVGARDLLQPVLGWGAIPANLVSVAIGAIPNYAINRYWTWHQTGKNRLWGEVVPFWAMSVARHDRCRCSRWPTPRTAGAPALAIALAQLAGFGVLWLAKFLVLDKVMWKIVHEIQPDVAIDEAEAGLVGALSLDGSDGEPRTPGQQRPNGATPASTVEPSARRPPLTEGFPQQFRGSGPPKLLWKSASASALGGAVAQQCGEGAAPGGDDARRPATSMLRRRRGPRS